MSLENLSHGEFWTQFQRYLGDHEPGIRIGKSQTSTASVGLRRSFYNLIPWRLLKGNQAGVWIRFNNPDGEDRYELAAERHRARIQTALADFGLEWQPEKKTIQLARGVADSTNGHAAINQWLTDALLTAKDLFTELFPPAETLSLEFRGDAVVNQVTGESLDVGAAIARLPWRAQQTGGSSWEDYPPYMPPHEFVVIGKCDYADWDTLEFACTEHPESYSAYFRGYQSPMHYWEPGDGYRYWRTVVGITMLNRCRLDSVEPPRRGTRISPADWGAPQWLPRGSGWPLSYLTKHLEEADKLGLNPDEESARCLEACAAYEKHLLAEGIEARIVVSVAPKGTGADA